MEPASLARDLAALKAENDRLRLQLDIARETLVLQMNSGCCYASDTAHEALRAFDDLKGKTLLDVGCNAGGVMKIAEEAALSVRAAEVPRAIMPQSVAPRM